MDWWSLGVTAFELKTAGSRPYDIGPKTSVTLALQMFESGLVKKDTHRLLCWSFEIIEFGPQNPLTPRFAIPFCGV